MITAKQIWDDLRAAELVPSIHWLAAPHEWREALIKIEDHYDGWWDEWHNAQRECSRSYALIETLQTEVAAPEKKLAENGKTP